MTPHSLGLRNMRSSDQLISLGDKSEMATTQVGDQPCQVCDRFGNPLAKTVLQEVEVIAKGYNLFSVTKLQVDGWKLHGDQNCIQLTRGAHTITFDIPISIRKR